MSIESVFHSVKPKRVYSLFFERSVKEGLIFQIRLSRVLFLFNKFPVKYDQSTENMKYI